MTGTFHIFDQQYPFFWFWNILLLCQSVWFGSVLLNHQHCSWNQKVNHRLSDFLCCCKSLSLSWSIDMRSNLKSSSSDGYVSNIAVSTWIVPVRPGASQGRIVIWSMCYFMNYDMRIQTLLSSERMAYNLGYATGMKNVMFDISLISLNLYLP